MKKQQCFKVPVCNEEGRCDFLLYCGPGESPSYTGTTIDQHDPSDGKYDLPVPELTFQIPVHRKVAKKAKKRVEKDDRTRVRVEESKSVEKQDQRRLGKSERNPYYTSPDELFATLEGDKPLKHDADWYASRSFDEVTRDEIIPFRDQWKPYLSQIAINPLNFGSTYPEFTTYTNDTPAVKGIKNSFNFLGKFAGPIALGAAGADLTLHMVEAYQNGLIETVEDVVEVVSEYAGEVTFEALQLATAALVAASSADTSGLVTTGSILLDPRLMVTSIYDDYMDITGQAGHFEAPLSSRVIQQDVDFVTGLLGYDQAPPVSAGVKTVLSMPYPDDTSVHGLGEYVSNVGQALVGTSTELDNVPKTDFSDEANRQITNMVKSIGKNTVETGSFIDTAGSYVSTAIESGLNAIGSWFGNPNLGTDIKHHPIMDSSEKDTSFFSTSGGPQGNLPRY